jgi:hypothetical protein
VKNHTKERAQRLQQALADHIRARHRRVQGADLSRVPALNLSAWHGIEHHHEPCDHDAYNLTKEPPEKR